jgi:hypothetical protein
MHAHVSEALAFSARSPRQKPKSDLKVFLNFFLLTMTIADTDCEILNSGIPSISAPACCGNNGIVCIDGRITEMYDISILIFVKHSEKCRGSLANRYWESD